ncbi:NHL repeat-containing protein [Spirosoma foliorum]|uniref:SMP-30/gluconolactonase/LRE family protein n=1 Tax=Spirosoma foliorum TaxID=2710596 RepID=A0A7G5GPT0_9BACT|nr:NHL repeat-containing protein [Spirosoma foliorum]QMW00872.1 SMP-30/gluconolactonase/LRE family protein [Spirosoma foliorum]
MKHLFLSHHKLTLCLSVILLLISTWLPAQIITTVAGSDLKGDGGAATAACLNGPSGVTVDKNGAVYIADQENNRIRKVSTNGIISTVAGSYLSRNSLFNGDGGPATSAFLGNPNSVIVDDSGNLYISEQSAGIIRKISTSGIITTVAGNGRSDPFEAGDGGPATAASLIGPTGIALDAAGNLYIADFYNNRIRKVSTSGIITTVAGDGNRNFNGDGGVATRASLYNPTGVAVDAAGNIYIADQGNCRIRKIDANGIITTIAGNNSRGFSGDGGVATAASLNNPTSVIVDEYGNIYITDSVNQRVRRVSTDGIITTVVGNGLRRSTGDGGLATEASLNNPVSTAFDNNGNLYIALQDGHQIRKVSSDGIITTVAGNGYISFSGDGGLATSASLYNPFGVTTDSSDNLYITDLFNRRIRKVSPDGIITTVAGNGNAGFSGDGGLATATTLNGVYNMIVDAAGNLYMADSFNHRVRKVSSSGIITTIAGNGSAGFSGDNGPAILASLNKPADVAMDRSGNLYIAELDNHRIRKIDSNGIITTVAGNGNTSFSGDGGLATAAGLNSPAKIIVDRNNNLYMADQYDHRIRKVSPDGIITTIAGNGNAGFSGDGDLATAASLNSPTGMALDNGNNLYVADLLNHRIRKVSSGGIITTVVGSDSVGTRGDGGLATAASLVYPSGVALDRRGNFYIADEGGNGSYRIRKVTSLVTVSIMSVKDGNWSNASTWNCNCVPTLDDVVTISNGHKITVNQAVYIQALKQLGTLLFDASGSITFRK